VGREHVVNAAKTSSRKMDRSIVVPIGIPDVSRSIDLYISLVKHAERFGSETKEDVTSVETYSPNQLGN